MQLKRQFEKVTDNNKKTGRARHTCPFQKCVIKLYLYEVGVLQTIFSNFVLYLCFKQLHEMLGSKSSVNPPYILNADSQTPTEGDIICEAASFAPTEPPSSPSPSTTSISCSSRCSKSSTPLSVSE